MTIREEIIAMNLSCNIERALLLILDDCGCDDALLTNDLSTLSWGVQKSLAPNQNGTKYAKITGQNVIGLTPINVDLTIKSNGNLWLNYTPKVYLERYKPHHTKDGANYTPIQAGFHREQENDLLANNRVNEFAGLTSQTIDMRVEAYFNYMDYGQVRALGVPRDFAYRSGLQAKQIFRFVMELDVNGTIVKVNSPTFQVWATSDQNQQSYFYHGIGFAYGSLKI